MSSQCTESAFIIQTGLSVNADYQSEGKLGWVEAAAGQIFAVIA